VLLSFFNSVEDICIDINAYTVDSWFRLTISNYQYQTSIFDFFANARIIVSMFSIIFLSLNYIGANLHRRCYVGVILDL
jgi:hypothetical protein